MDSPKLVVMFYGRFQPPHAGHIKVYKALVSKFGNNNVYIGTSNKVDKERSPLSFQWKQKLFRSLGVPSNRVLQTKSNYNTEEVQKLLGVDPNNTVFVAAVGLKDAERLGHGAYFEKYKKGMPLEPMSKKGYYFVVPKESSELKVNGKVLSATMVRAMMKMKNPNYAFLKQAMGTTRAQVDNLKQLFEHFVEIGDLIQEGGLGGHMSHPYEDRNLKFSDMEDMITKALTGEISKEETREKTDGQNLFASIINGQIKFARNKTNAKNRGAQAMSIQDMAKKWKDKPDVADAFINGAKTLESVLLKLSEKEMTEIFDNGRNWLNFEVIWSSNKNVIDYDRNIIVFHNVSMMDDTGSDAGLSKKAESTLYSKIQQFNSTKQTQVYTPPIIQLKGSVDFSKKKSYFLGKLSNFMSQQKLGKSATLGQWMDKFWEKKIRAAESKLNHRLDNNTRNKIIRRFTDWDKGYKLSQMRKDIGYEPLFNLVKELDSNIAKLSKDATMPLELLFLELGVEVMQNMDTFLSANPDNTVKALRKDIAKKISQIRSSNDIGDLDKMRESLRKVQAIGGFDKLVPSEGIVFKYGGKTYKLTGLFAPINQLMGLGRFER